MRSTLQLRRPCTLLRSLAACAIAVATILGLAAIPGRSSADPSIGQLQSQLGAEQGRQQSLAASISNLSGLITSLNAQITLVETREAAVRADLIKDRAALAAVQLSLTRERALLVVLRGRLAWARSLLGRQLLSNYEQAKPNLVSVVLESSGFTDLLDRLTFLHDAQQAQQTIISITRNSKERADAAAKRLAGLETSDRQITVDAAMRVDALAGMNLLLQSKQGALQQARAAQQNALAASRARGSELQGEITRIQAEQAAAERAAIAQQFNGAGGGGGGGSGPTPVGPTYGPSGSWAIPYSVVLCESGGQDLTPNSAGASGYYQILPSTWKLFGGSGSAAYRASKAEQDSVATRIWNSGAGAGNWDCSSIVGIH